jgi:hypothetical protein
LGVVAARLPATPNGQRSPRKLLAEARGRIEGLNPRSSLREKNQIRRVNISLVNGERTGVARVEIGGRRQGQEVWARWIDGRVQGDREFLKAAGLDPGTRFEDPHAFVELIEGLLDKGSANVVVDVPPRQE